MVGVWGAAPRRRRLKINAVQKIRCVTNVGLFFLLIQFFLSSRKKAKRIVMSLTRPGFLVNAKFPTSRSFLFGCAYVFFPRAKKIECALCKQHCYPVTRRAECCAACLPKWVLADDGKVNPQFKVHCGKYRRRLLVEVITEDPQAARFYMEHFLKIDASPHVPVKVDEDFILTFGNYTGLSLAQIRARGDIDYLYRLMLQPADGERALVAAALPKLPHLFTHKTPFSVFLLFSFLKSPLVSEPLPRSFCLGATGVWGQAR